MSKMVLAALILASSFAFAQQKSDLGELEVGAQAQDSQAYVSQTDAEMIAHMNQEIDAKCDKHGCTYVSRVDQKKGWTLTFNAGNGQPSNGAGSNYYIGSGSVSQSNQNYIGVTATLQNLTCTSDFKLQMDEFKNRMSRSIGERESYNAVGMKPLTTDAKFMQLTALEIYKQLGQAGCLH